MFIRIPKQIVPVWLKLNPDAKRFVALNGCLYMELNKYLYGLPASSNRFHEHLKGILERGGYTKSVPRSMPVRQAWTRPCRHWDPCGRHNRHGANPEGAETGGDDSGEAFQVGQAV